jgi:hypothetical protein
MHRYNKHTAADKSSAKSNPLPVHPAAEIFPPMEGGEFEAFKADIAKHGLHHPIITIGEGADIKVLAGRNRQRACIELDIEPQYRPFQGDDPIAFVIGDNIHRRHLTVEQKRDFIAKLIKLQPEKSNLQIAKVAKASPTTVGKQRAKMETKGDVSKLETRTDTKGRKQPAKKKRRTEDDFIKGMKAKRSAQFGINADDILAAATTPPPQATADPNRIPDDEIVKRAAMKKLRDEIKIVVERALNAKRGDRDHQTAVFGAARACLDEMEQARQNREPAA